MPVLRLPAVQQQVGLSKSTIYAEIAAGRMPAPIKLGKRASGWLASEIDAWLGKAKRTAERAGLPLP